MLGSLTVRWKQTHKYYLRKPESLKILTICLNNTVVVKIFFVMIATLDVVIAIEVITVVVLFL